MFKAAAVHSNVTTKQWKLVVTPLSGTTPLHQFEFEGGNWMAALRDARHELGEDGGLPSGASCTVAPDGTVTILDPDARRKFLLTPISKPMIPQRAEQRPAEPVARTKFQTVGYAHDEISSALAEAKAQAQAQAAAPQSAAAAPQPARTPAQAPQAAPPVAQQPARPAAAQPARPAAVQPPIAAQPARPAAVQPPIAAQRAPAAAAQAPAAQPPRPAAAANPAASGYQPRTPIKRSATADYEEQSKWRAAGKALQAIAVGAPPAAAPAPAPATKPPRLDLELLLSRDVEPTPDNPLTYRERAYLIQPGSDLGDAEAALRKALADLERTLESVPRGKFVNLAVFDHSWTDRPQRPPLVALEWRDWRGDPVIEYPAEEEDEEQPLEPDERLATVFEALHELAHLRTAAEGLEFAVRLLGHAVPAEALSACLYDINTDELRFVAVLGKNASAVQGKAVSRGRGLFARATQLDHTALVVNDLESDGGFDPALDGRHGVTTRNVLLRSVSHDGRLLGMLQVLNRANGSFTAADVHLINYIAERLAEYLRDAKARVRT